MKRFTLLFLIGLGIFTQHFSAYGQGGPFIAPIHNPTTRTTNFQTMNLLNGSGVFYIFGDGHFSIQNHPSHQFRKDGGFDTFLYAVDPYTVTPPAIHDDNASVTYTNTNVPQGSLTASFGMSGKTVSVGQSWNAADNYRLVLIVSFTHPETANPNALPIDGTIDLLLDKDLSYSGIHYTTSDWASYSGMSSTGIPAVPNKISWRYTQLQPEEIRHVYVEVEVLRGTSKRIKAIAEMQPDQYDCGLENCIYSDINRMPRTDKPKDPNRMYVDQSCIKASIPERQLLDYEVHFQNEGTGPAKNVVLEVDINNNLSLYDINIKGSSAPCIFDIDPGTGMLVITFPNIQLPGSQQIRPQSYHFNETTGYVEFSVCSDPFLDDGSFIDGVTNIFFDAEPPVMTNWVHTLAEHSCPMGVICDIEGNEEGEYRTANSNLLTSPTFQVSPNPFSDEIRVDYVVEEPRGEQVQIYLSNLAGQRVSRMLMNQHQTAGKYQQRFDLSDLTSGVYLVTIQQSNQIKTRKLVKLNPDH